VIEVNNEIKLTKMNEQKDITWFHLARRVFRKYRVFAVIAKHWKDLQRADYLYVGFPGHFDMLYVYFLGKILHKKIVFNPIVVFYTGYTEEQALLKKTSLKARILKWGETIIYHMADLVLADTPNQREFLINTFKLKESKVVTLPLGADDSLYSYTRLENTSQKLNVTYYGLYSLLHGVQHIIEAARILKDDNNIIFHMVGKGQTFQSNFERAQHLNLTNIHFHHNVPEKDHPGLLQKADVFLGFLEEHPSIYKVIGNKIYQGLALGKVVITADSPLVRSYFENGVHMMLTPAAQPQELARMLVDLQKNPTKRIQIAEAGHRLFITKFTPRAIAKELLHILNCHAYV